MNPAITMQVVAHSFLWIFLVSFEMIGAVMLEFLPSGYLKYVAIFFFSVMGFFLIERFGNNALLRDMRELFLYDIVVQGMGVALSYSGSKLFGYQVLIGALTILKFVRLLWLRREADFGSEIGWPVFGVLGYVALRNRARAAQSEPPVLMASYRELSGFFLLALLLSAMLVKVGFEVTPALCGLIPIILLGLYYEKFIAYLMQAETSRIEAEKKLAVAEATAAINAELSAKNAQLQEANQERDVMLADLMVRNDCLRDASHDLAAPAFWITSCAQQLAVARDDPSRAALARQLLDSVGHYNQLLQATIHSAKLITHIEQPDMVPISVNRLVVHLWDKYLAIFEDKGLRFGIYKANQYVLGDDGSVTPDIKPERSALAFHLASDEHVLMRILNNLIMNAVRNTAHGRVRVAFRKRAGNVCWIEVRDSGKGFEGADGPDWVANFDQVARRIRGGKMKASEAASHGLGINNIRNLGNAIGSKVMLYSRPGHGSVFRLEVPLATAPVLPDPAQEQTRYFG